MELLIQQLQLLQYTTFRLVATTLTLHPLANAGTFTETAHANIWNKHSHLPSIALTPNIYLITRLLGVQDSIQMMKLQSNNTKPNTLLQHRFIQKNSGRLRLICISSILGKLLRREVKVQPTRFCYGQHTSLTLTCTASHLLLIRRISTALKPKTRHETSSYTVPLGKPSSLTTRPRQTSHLLPLC